MTRYYTFTIKGAIYLQNCNTKPTQHLFLGQNFIVGYEPYAFIRHAVNTPQVATVGYGKTEVLGDSVGVILNISLRDRSER